MPKEEPDDFDTDFNPIEHVVLEAKCYDARDTGDPPIGVLRLTFRSSTMDVLLTEPMANDIIQTLRDFLSEDADKLPDGE